MRRFCTILLSLLLCSTMPWPATTHAQADPITWQVVPGFDGAYRAGAWFPVTITIANSGPEVRGTIEFRLRGDGAATWSQPIDLPLNANKRITLPVLSDSNHEGARQADLTLRAGNRVIKSEVVRLNAIASMQLVLGVLSDEGNALPELSNVRGVEGMGNTRIVRLTATTVPDRAEFLQTLSALFVHNFDTTTLSEAQRAAIHDWVAGGGQLIVGGDPRVFRGLEDVLPATVAEPTFSFDPAALARNTGWRPGANATPLTAARIAPRAGAETVLAADEAPLLVRQRYGVGLITVAAFDLATLREAGDPADFWSRVLPFTGTQPVVTQLRDQGFWTLQQSIQLPALRLPSTFGFFGFLLFYIIVVGPLNYLVLRRFDRREWAYITVPLVVLVFSIGAYLWGTAGRGSDPSLTQLTVVRAASGSAQGQALSFLALFSPTRQTYNLGVDREALLADLQQPWQRSGGAIDVLYAEDSTRAPELLVDVGGVRTMAVEATVPTPAVEVTWRKVDGAEQVTLRNRSNERIEDVLLLRGDGRTQNVGALEPGDEQTIRFDPIGVFQGGFVAGDNGAVINRQTVLSQLAGIIVPGVWGGPFPQAVPPPPMPADPFAPQAAPIEEANAWPDPQRDLYVFGWRSGAPVAITLNDRPVASQGETLYIWAVRKEG